VPTLTQPSTLCGMVKWISAFELSNTKMAMMYVGHIAAYRRTCSPSRLAWSEGWRPSGAGLHTSDEPGELSKWLSRDDSTINIVIRISIIIILINPSPTTRRHRHASHFSTSQFTRTSHSTSQFTISHFRTSQFTHARPANTHYPQTNCRTVRQIAIWPIYCTGQWTVGYVM